MSNKNTTLQSKILYRIEQNPRIPETTLAKELSISREVLRYNLRKLEEEIVKGYGAWIDVSALGFKQYKFYLKISANTKLSEEFFSYLKNRDDLIWFGLGDGSWDVGLTIYAKNNEEFYQKKNELLSKFGNIIVDTKTGMLVDVHIFPLKVLDKNAKEIKEIILFNESTNYNLDDVDKRILKTLFDNSKTRIVDIANNSNCSIDTARSRIKKLEENKIIKGYNAKINYSALGYTYYKTFIYFNGISEDDEKKLHTFSTLHPNILHLIRQISPWEIELEMIVKDYKEYSDIVRKIRDTFPTIKNIESTIIYEDYVFPKSSSIFKSDK